MFINHYGPISKVLYSTVPVRNSFPLIFFALHDSTETWQQAEYSQVEVQVLRNGNIHYHLLVATMVFFAVRELR